MVYLVAGFLLFVVGFCAGLATGLFGGDRTRNRPLRSEQKARRRAENVAGRLVNAITNNAHAPMFEIVVAAGVNTVSSIHIKSGSRDWMPSLHIHVFVDSILVECQKYNTANATHSFEEIDLVIDRANSYMSTCSL